MDIVSKLTDALSMFWQSIDDEQRKIVLYAGIYLGVTLALGLQGLASERRETRMRQQILAELRGDGAAV